MLLVLGIMILSGILAGLTNYFLTEKSRKPYWRPILANSLLGIASALIVPLFLNMTSSHLIVSAQKNPTRLFVLNGICLVFAFLSCRFKDTLFKQRRQNDGKGHSNIDSLETDDGLDAGRHTLPQSLFGRAGMSESELKVLSIIARSKGEHRSLVDLLKDPELADENINETLSSLMAKGFIEQNLNKESRLRLYITPKGEHLLRKISK